MDVNIEIAELGALATTAQIVDTHTDVPSMTLVILVGLFNASGDKLQTFTVEHHLDAFPIPSVEDQWAIIKPRLDAMQTA